MEFFAFFAFFVAITRWNGDIHSFFCGRSNREAGTKISMDLRKKIGHKEHKETQKILRSLLLGGSLRGFFGLYSLGIAVGDTRDRESSDPSSLGHFFFAGALASLDSILVATCL